MNINENICFVEGLVTDTINVEADNRTPSDMINLRDSRNLNIIKQRQVYVRLIPGAFSKIDNIDIFSTDFYKGSEEYVSQSLFRPYNDNFKPKVKNLSNNPLIYRSNLGSNASEDFDDIFTYPFEDRENVNTNKSISNYRFYVNAYSVQGLKQSISVLGTLSEIEGTITQEKNILGITGHLGVKDSRGRSVVISDEYDPAIELKEGFLDEEIENIDTGTGLIQRKFRYENRIINGSLYTVLIVDEGSYSFIAKVTSKLYYFNEENNNISPFNDNITENNNAVSTSRGSDSDNNSGVSVVSFPGEVN